MEINFEKRLVTLAGKEIHLTPIEYKLIAMLSRNIGKVLTLIREVWDPYGKGQDESEIQTLRVNMANIRRKLENPGEPQYIVTEVGVGYRMIE